MPVDHMVGGESEINGLIKARSSGAPVVPNSTQGTVDRCYICLGLIEDENDYFECFCGNLSHESCSKSVGSCSICGREYTPSDFLVGKDFTSLVKKGKAVSAEKRYKEAITWFNRALKVKADSYYVLNCKGMALTQLGRFEDALSCYDGALELEKSHDLFFNRANILFRMNRLEETLESINKAIAMDRCNARSWYLKGMTMAKIKKPRIAIKCYDKAIDLIPENHLFWYGKAKALLVLERKEKALECFETALEIAPKDVNSLYEKGKLLASLNRDNEAAFTFNEVLKWEPEHTGAIEEKERLALKG